MMPVKRSLAFLLLLAGCVGIPEHVTPVSGFKLENYVGRWYEIARLDHSFERGLTHVTAEYSVGDDNSVRVVNRGYDARKKRWKEAKGKAFFVKGPDQGYLKVSFFGPFYGSYIIFDLDHDTYDYALVCGPDRSYLWLLARSPTLPPDIQQALVAKAAALGFATDELIFVDHQ